MDKSTARINIEERENVTPPPETLDPEEILALVDLIYFGAEESRLPPS